MRRRCSTSTSRPGAPTRSAHLSALHHPCVGDLTYGATPSSPRGSAWSGSGCVAVGLGFEHPGTGEYVTFTSPYPEDLQRARPPLTP